VVTLRLQRDGLKFPPQCACCLATTKETRRITVRQIDEVWGNRQVFLVWLRFRNRPRSSTGRGPLPQT